MNAKDFLKTVDEERSNEGIWNELARIVNPTATLTEDQCDFVRETVIEMCAEARVTNPAGITAQTIWSLATFINSCR
jgi:hypothetical protein